MGKDKYDLRQVELGNENPGFQIDITDGKGVITTNGAKATNGKPVVASKDTVQLEEGTDRQQWSNPVEFLLSCIAMSVGLGNVWRFPFTAYENGGGAFLIPYIIVLLIVGKPFYYMELALGQFSSSGPVRVWEVVPALKGVGIGQLVSTTGVFTYYCSIMAITMFYFFASFTAELPWARCGEGWVDCADSFGSNGSISSSEIYFKDIVLQEKDQINDGVGYPEWRLTLCLLFSWVTICLVLIKGVQSSGKAAYFLALFPYVVLIILLVRGATLPGAVDGILYFITPQWEQLLNPKVWYQAVTQSFFSLGVAFGGLTMYASYSPLHHNFHRDAMIVTTMDTFTSLLAGFTIFAILGNLAYEKGTDISNVVSGGSGLAFISYPETIAKFNEVPQLFSVLFFLMLYTLGIGSAISLVGAVITAYCDQFPTHKRWIVTLVVCTFGFLIGLVYVTPGGQWILDLVDYFSGTFIIYILALTEIIGISWIYGVNNFCRDLEFMLGIKVGFYWRVCWGFVTPIFLLAILIYSLITLTPIQYQGKDYPDAAYACGWVLFFIGVVQVPFWAIFAICKYYKTSIPEAIKKAFRPTKRWGPKSAKSRQEWEIYKEEEKEKMRNETKSFKFLHLVFGVTRRRPSSVSSSS
ncbi:sodium-dependent nutrient amino acid transporter 1 isoform X3 [Neocloeon triangulifer]|uniref:sodium-dependent nutrient amino acid transporter 1 isoform X3 n=1 Tax=Neocloeon triangulifer TaxID=2078957 RepID=UPI00286F9BCE|nr:sodium-dependent nutrient amino acid transporter 1 isoform X3 [Neocloeon triangulifer]